MGRTVSNGVERVRASKTGDEHETVAIHQQYLGESGYAENSVIASGGVKNHRHDERSWNGIGILKTVDMETWESSVPSPDDSISRPRRAVLQPSHSDKRDIWRP